MSTSNDQTGFQHFRAVSPNPCKNELNDRQYREKWRGDDGPHVQVQQQRDSTEGASQKRRVKK